MYEEVGKIIIPLRCLEVTGVNIFRAPDLHILNKYMYSVSSILEWMLELDKSTMNKNPFETFELNSNCYLAKNKVDELYFLV